MNKPTSIFNQVQNIICDQLNADDTLSSANILFIAENAKDIDYEVTNALGKQGIVGVVMTPRADYIGITSRGEIAYDLRGITVQIVENVPVNRGLPDSITALDAAQRVQEVLSSPNVTAFGVMNPVSIEQGEESGLIVCQASFNCNVHMKYINPNTTKVQYTASSGLPDWEGDIVGELSKTSIPNKSNAEVVEIGNHVTSIGYDAFEDCRAISSVTMPNTLTSIGDSAFNNCQSLTNVIIPDSVTSLGDSVFYNCRGLTNITIGSGVTSLGSGMFTECVNLTSVTIPDNVTSMGSYSFSGCQRLASVTIGSGVTSIGEYAFFDCGRLMDATFSGKTKATVKGMANHYWELPYGCTIHCTDENIIVGSETVVYYTDGRKAELEIQGELGGDSIPDKESMSELVIGSTVTSIGEWAFAYCSGLEIVSIPGSVTSIGTRAFYACSGITGVNIIEGVTSIGNEAFSGCTGLTSVDIPNSVTSIGNWAFEGCSGLTELTIGNNVTSIGSAAFYDCSELTSVTFSGKDKATVQGMDNYSWEFNPGCVLHCTDGDIVIGQE